MSASASLRVGLGTFTLPWIALLEYHFPMSSLVLQLDSRDNVLVALSNLKKGDAIQFGGRSHQLQTDVPAKHKFATVDLAIGDRVVMYGGLVGKAVKPIAAGEVVTVTNIRHEASPFHEKSQAYQWAPPDVSRWAQRTFQGYARSDGQVGTRNYWIVVPLVFCENKNIQVLKQAFEEELGFAAPQVYRQQVAELAQLYREGKIGNAVSTEEKGAETAPARKRLFENVNGVRFLLHEGGCGGTREDSQNLCGLIAGYIHHPNVAGATVLSLGCQHAQIEILRDEIRKRDPNFTKPLFILEQQKSGSEAAMMRDAIGQTFQGLVEANKARGVLRRCRNCAWG